MNPARKFREWRWRRYVKRVQPWLVAQTDDLHVHVIPIGDTWCHEAEDCACGPRLEPVEQDDGTVGWMLTHHSLDGREAKHG